MLSGLNPKSHTDHARVALFTFMNCPVNALDKLAEVRIIPSMKSISDAKAEYLRAVEEVHRRIIDMYFNQKIENMSEIARKVGYTRERVRQIIDRELEKRGIKK